MMDKGRVDWHCIGSNVLESVEEGLGWPTTSRKLCAGSCCGEEYAGDVPGGVYGGCESLVMLAAEVGSVLFKRSTSGVCDLPGKVVVRLHCTVHVCTDKNCTPQSYRKYTVQYTLFGIVTAYSLYKGTD